MEKTTEQPAVARHIDRIFVHLAKIVRLFRLIDAAVFTAIPVVGILLSIYHQQFTPIDYNKIFLNTAPVYLLALHVFFINDWADFKRDKNDKLKNINSALSPGFSKRMIFTLAMITGVSSLIWLLYFSIHSFVIGVLLILFSLLYSTSGFYFHGKGVPVLATLLHIAGGMLAYMLGYIFYDEIQPEAFLTGVMFGVFLSAGHLFQEIQDFEVDRKNQIRTTAGLIGKKAAAWLGLILLLCGHALLQYLIYSGIFPVVSVANWMAFALVVTFILCSMRKELCNSSVKLLRCRYRIVYAVFGLYMFIKIVIQI